MAKEILLNRLRIYEAFRRAFEQFIYDLLRFIHNGFNFKLFGERKLTTKSMQVT